MLRTSGIRIRHIGIFRGIPPIMEKQKYKKLSNSLETGIMELQGNIEGITSL